jgi:hypothetical protein
VIEHNKSLSADELGICMPMIAPAADEETLLHNRPRVAKPTR